jgi:hypothetical protein
MPAWKCPRFKTPVGPALPSFQKIIYHELYFLAARIALIQIAAPFRGWIVYQINPATFVQDIALFGAAVHPAQSANVIIKANFPL